MGATVSATETVVANAIETWYSANYASGIRPKGIDRQILAKFIAQLLDARSAAQSTPRHAS
jgi:hypothetical protein